METCVAEASMGKCRTGETGREIQQLKAAQPNRWLDAYSNSPPGIESGARIPQAESATTSATSIYRLGNQSERLVSDQFLF